MYPIAYELLSNILQKHLLAEEPDFRKFAHHRPIGCMNDICLQKADIQLKLRTGDICKPCYERLLAAGVSETSVNEVLEAFEKLCKQMLFRAGFRCGPWPSPLAVDQKGQIALPAQGNLTLKLSPIQRALYIFFLRHPEGIRLAAIRDHMDELSKLYARVCVFEDRKAQSDVITRLVSQQDNSLYEKISEIKRAMINVFGKDNRLASPYCIAGQRGEV